MLTKHDLEQELNSKISADGKSVVARHHEECARVREAIARLLTDIEDTLEDQSFDVLENVYQLVCDAADELGIAY